MTKGQKPRELRRIPVFVLTGFLGSGKTTLLSRLIRSHGMEGTLVVINEFGEVGLDHLLVEATNEQTILMDSGCVCCTMRSDLAETLSDVALRIARGELPVIHRIVLETTGLADPGPVLQTLVGDPMVAASFRLGGMWSTVDAVHAGSTLDRYAESRRQIAMADLLLITKADIAPPATVEALADRIMNLNGVARICDVHEATDLSALLNETSSDPSLRSEKVKESEDEHHQGSAHAAAHLHDEHIRSLSVSYSGSIALRYVASFLEDLVRDHGEQILRIKGVVAIAGREAPIAMHGVQHLLHPPVPLDGWADSDRTSRIVFIMDGLDPSLVKSRFDAWLNTTPRAL
ncbi:MAG: GTP-binding protein [Betaproteobacteria bacterium]|nr:GTP-binding protein [Betaproteobacteria bacterium]